ncbi:hypothetical protein TI39_contig418g00002 [Zymoseptoria brevis]|uniref:ER transporter 6TM N-terminal domain-containing protein n=1 Tax=Zymoseptoria brevis TaxID=1047168 RepID=A0A0F4GM29_9PEZI|nr:hypothetical protein TI39_contig418g00002 [Zymoseptoria brevis]
MPEISPMQKDESDRETIVQRPSDQALKHELSNDAAGEAKPSLRSRVASLWTSTGIDLRTYETMFKSALAPTISLAAFQGSGWANFFTTLGYLVIIMTILPVVIMPRSKFLQTMLISVVFVSLASSISLLGIYCMVTARINTTGDQIPGQGGAGTSGLATQGAATAGYNSSASAVAGVWLFFQIFIVSVLRAKLPQYNVPCIMWAVVANIACIYGPQFNTMVQGEAFVRRLLLACFTGFGIATGVSLLIFPLTSRVVFFKGMAGYIASLRGALQANLDYMHSLEEDDPFTVARTNTIGDRPPKSEKAKVFKQKLAGLTAVHAKLSTDLAFAKREVAIGKLGPDDLQECFRRLRAIMIPTMNLSCMADIFVRVAEERGWDSSVDMAQASVEDAANADEKIRIETVQEWHELMKYLREPFNAITATLLDGLDHIAITLQLASKPKSDDVESSGSEPRPGDEEFAVSYARRRLEFLKSKEMMLRGWCNIHDINLPEDFFSNPDADFDAPKWMQEGSLTEPHRQLRKQLYLCLYMEFLLINVGRRVGHLIKVADSFKAHGKLSRSRLVVPGYKRMRKWFRSLFNNRTDTADNEELHGDGNNSNTVYLGSAYSKRRDAEHLPPANAWEKFGDRLRCIPSFFKSPAASFGFRVACATLTIGIVGLLHDTQTFFTKQRLFWAQIMVSIAMSPSAGQSLRGFFLRIAGTSAALIVSWIAWYIGDEHTASIIVFYFIFLHGFAWIMLKKPAYIPGAMIGQITMSLIVGYELQVRTLGVAVATSNGQAYFPVYELGPIRLATVLGGMFVGWIFTWFPYPISEHNLVRKNLGSALYLLANYYSVMHETVGLRLRDEQGDMSNKNSPGRKLEKARMKLYSKTNLNINGLSTQAEFLAWDVPIGGRFPQERYQRLITRMQSILNFMSLVSVASQSFTELREDGGNEHGLKWLAGFQKLVTEASYTSEQVTTLLALLSASVTTEQALPPYLRVPEPYGLSQKLQEMDKDILSVRHIAEPGYASFAVVQIGTKYIHEDLKALVEGVKELVGELDFSYHIVSTADPSRTKSEETLVFTRSKSDSDGRAKQD